MQPADSTQSPAVGSSSGGATRILFADAVRFGEIRRLHYNLVLFAVVLTWLLATWPQFRPAFTLNSLLLLFVLALVANVCYCAAYLIDIPLQLSPLARRWRHRRWLLWTLGTALAVGLANYWISDEIYPLVR